MALTIFLFYLLSANFKQTAYFPHGVMYPPCAYDSDHDGTPELFTLSPPDTGTMVYEHTGNNHYNETRLFNINIVAIGNGDNDSLTDAYGQSAPYGQAIGVWESRSFNNYPDSLVWNYPMPDTEQAYAICPGIFVDFDQDGKMNLITPIYPVDLLYFENSQDNYYTRIDSLWFPSVGGPVQMVVTDFDGDSLLEMIGGDSDSKIYVFENTVIGVDSFHLVWNYQLPFGGAYIIAKGNDMDSDGKLEFIIGSWNYDRWCFTLFETNGNNSYEKKWQYFYYYGGSLTGGDVACGDIDGDGIEEMVTFGGLVLNVWKCVGPDSFVSIWNRWYYGDLCDGLLLVYDLNQNGLGEIVVSGGNWGSTPPAKTYIYEKMPDVTWIYPAQYDTLWANDTVNLRFRLDETVSLESLRLYIAHPLLGCWLIYQGLPTDTTCTFVVPDTQSNMAFKFWVAVKGLGRYDSIVSPPFYIKRRTGIREYATGSLPGAIGLEVYPNPFREKMVFKYALSSGYQEKNLLPTIRIYDATGRLVKTLNLFQGNHLTIQALRRQNYGASATINQLVWFGDDDSGNKVPSGVYFVCLQESERLLVKKIIKLE